MNPKAIDDMGMAMADVYAAVTDRILINLAHHFPYVQTGQHMGSWEYQTMMLAQMGKVEKETIAIIAQSLGGADEALKQALETAILQGLKNEEPKLRQAAMNGLLKPNGYVPELDPSQLQAFTAYYKQSADKLNLVNTVMLDSTKQAYQATVADVAQKIANTQGIMNAAAGEVITGVSTWNGAMHSAVQKMVANGITGFIDHAGHKWSPEAYVAMDIKTTMFNTARQAVWERSEQYGSDLYQVSSHNAARPLCYPWQGKVISTSGRTGITHDLDGNEVVIHSQDEIESFRYGGGLFGVNCQHYPMTFIPEFSTLKGEPQDQATNDKQYAETQQQRALERRLREEKRDLEVMKAQGAPAEQIKAQRERVRNASADIDEFCDKTGLPRRRNREYTPINAEFPENIPPIKPIDPNTPPINAHVGDGNIPPKAQAKAQPEENTLDDLFGDLWSGNVTEDEFFATKDTEEFHPSTKYGSFGIQNKDYPKDLQLTASEETYIENYLKDVRGEKVPKDFEYHQVMATALRPVKTIELNDMKMVSIQQVNDSAVAKLTQAEQMIAQRKAEGYVGKSREQSWQDWKRLKSQLTQAEDEFEHGQILSQSRVGEEGIQYWYSQRKQANTELSFVEFARKVVSREHFALEHGFDGTIYD